MQGERTSDQEHDDEDDWEAPEGDRHRLEGKVLHIVQLLQTAIPISFQH